MLGVGNPRFPTHPPSLYETLLRVTVLLNCNCGHACCLAQLDILSLQRVLPQQQLCLLVCHTQFLLVLKLITI